MLAGSRVGDETVTPIDAPRIFAADDGRVTVVWTQQLETGDKNQASAPYDVYCSQLNENRWSAPNDIFASPGAGTLRFLNGVLDGQGQLHLVWTGEGSMLYYSHADNAGACSPLSWTTPTVISEGPVLDGAITADDAGNLHVAYAARSGNVYHTQSTDNGANWSSVSNVSAISDPGIGPAFPRLSVSSDGVVHVIWSEVTVPDGAHRVGLFYSRSTDHGQTWSQPLQLAGEDYDEGNVLAVADQVHIVWNGRVGLGGRYHQWSSDKGVTWSRPAEAIRRGTMGGMTRAPGLAVDSAGTVHMVSGYGDGPAVHVTWDGREWSGPSSISGTHNDGVEQAQIAVSGGNRLHAVFVQYLKPDASPDKYRMILAYSRGHSSAPEQTPVPAPSRMATRLPAQAPVSRPSATKASSPEPAALAVIPDPPPITQNDTEASLLLAVLPAGLLVGAVMVVWFVGRRKRF